MCVVERNIIQHLVKRSQRFEQFLDLQTSESALTSTTRSKKMVLLQTARTYAHARDGEVAPVRVLLDNGSQRSYLTNSLKTRLGLKPLKKEIVNLNVFEYDSFRKQICDLVKVKLQCRRNEVIEIIALGFQTMFTVTKSHQPLSISSSSTIRFSRLSRNQ